MAVLCLFTGSQHTHTNVSVLVFTYDILFIYKMKKKKQNGFSTKSGIFLPPSCALHPPHPTPIFLY